MRPLRLPALLLLCAAAAVPPVGGLTVSSTWDAGLSLDVGDGVGLYEPTAPSYCLALVDDVHLPQELAVYYAPPFRYFPGVAARHGTVPVDLPEPTGCAGFVPGDRVIADVALDAGSRVWIDYALLSPNEVASLSSLTLDLQYCSTPGLSATGGLLPVFTGRWATCTAAWTTYSPLSCPSYDPGEPIYLKATGGCNREVGAPPGDHVTQVCASVDVIDILLGVAYTAADSDFYTVLDDGSLALWVSNQGTSPTGLYPNVANLEGDQPAPSC